MNTITAKAALTLMKNSAQYFTQIHCVGPSAETKTSGARTEWDGDVSLSDTQSDTQ
jgi:hypothetical protein